MTLSAIVGCKGSRSLNYFPREEGGYTDFRSNWSYYILYLPPLLSEFFRSILEILEYPLSSWGKTLKTSGHFINMEDPIVNLGPVVQYSPLNLQAGVFPRSRGKIFMLVTDKDGDDQLSEVSEDFYAPEVPIESQRASSEAPEPHQPM